MFLVRISMKKRERERERERDSGRRLFFVISDFFIISNSLLSSHIITLPQG